MTRITNEELYVEFRKTQRRQIAIVTATLSYITLVGFAYLALPNEFAVFLAITLSGIFALLNGMWLLANEGNSTAQWVFLKLRVKMDGQWESELKKRYGDAPSTIREDPE